MNPSTLFVAYPCATRQPNSLNNACRGLVDSRKIESSTSTVQALIKRTAVNSQLAGSFGMAARLSPQHVIEIQHGMVKKIIQGITLGVGGEWPAPQCDKRDPPGIDLRQLRAQGF